MSNCAILEWNREMLASMDLKYANLSEKITTLVHDGEEYMNVKASNGSFEYYFECYCEYIQQAQMFLKEVSIETGNFESLTRKNTPHNNDEHVKCIRDFYNYMYSCETSYNHAWKNLFKAKQYKYYKLPIIDFDKKDKYV